MHVWDCLRMSHIVFLHFIRAPFWCPTFSFLSCPTLPANSYFVAIIPTLAHCEFEMINKGRFRNKITIYHSYNIHLVAILSTSFSHLLTCSKKFFSIEILYLAGKESSDPAAVTFHFLLPDGTTRDTMAVWGCGRTGGKINSWRSSAEITKILMKWRQVPKNPQVVLISGKSRVVKYDNLAWMLWCTFMKGGEKQRDFLKPHLYMNLACSRQVSVWLHHPCCLVIVRIGVWHGLVHVSSNHLKTRYAISTN